MYAFDFDATDTAEPVDLDGRPSAADGPALDLDGALAAQFGPGAVIESFPIHTEILEEIALTIIRITHQRRARFQTYARSEYSWALVGVHGNYVDSLGEVLAWKRYIRQGGTLAGWMATHEWVTPESRLV